MGVRAYTWGFPNDLGYVPVTALHCSPLLDWKSFNAAGVVVGGTESKAMYRVVPTVAKLTGEAIEPVRGTEGAGVPLPKVGATPVMLTWDQESGWGGSEGAVRTSAGTPPLMTYAPTEEPRGKPWTHVHTGGLAELIERPKMGVAVAGVQTVAEGC